VAAASPQVAPGLWEGDNPLVEAIPRAHGAALLLLSLPSFASVAAVAGLALSGFAVWQNRDKLSGNHRFAFRNENLNESPNEKGSSGYPTLALLSLGALLLWPLVCPPALAR